jgi:hypothetical protein
MDRTQWRSIYANVRRDVLLAATRLPDRYSLTNGHQMGCDPTAHDLDVLSPKEDEQKIACIIGAFDVILDRCEYTVRHTSRRILCWLASARAHDFHDKPFSLVFKESSERKYRHLEKRLLVFIFRLSRMSTVIRGEEIGKRMSPVLLTRIESLWDHDAWGLFDWTQGLWPKAGRYFDYTHGAGKYSDESECADWEFEREQTPTAHSNIIMAPGAPSTLLSTSPWTLTKSASRALCC